MAETQQIVHLSDLISRAQPLTGTSSFTYNFQFSSSISQPPTPSPNPSPSSNPNVLKPLNFPALLIGTLNLPSHSKNSDSSNIECCCFQFDDSSATVCCDILHFCPEIIGRKIRILAWNFLPLSFPSGSGGSGGFLEIIRWEFAGWFQVPVSFPLVSEAVNCSEDPKCKYSIFGLLESVSPPSVVPCSAGTDISENLCGFLAKILVCVCKSCKSKDFNRGIADFTEENYQNHVFRKCLIVYFVGAASSWLPVFLRLVRSMISLSGLKKKLVYIGKEESQMMLVTTDKTSLHLPKFRNKWSLNVKDEIRWLGEVGCYAGTVTGIYMQGIVVELDGNVMLLLTDHQLMLPHSLRVGTIIFVRNTHFLQTKFSWTKLLILGACFITSISVESFSPLETKCHIKLIPHKVLRKVLSTLTFSARLWVLIVVSCLRIKFAGILSEKEILGSKNKDGLALAYITSQLPSSVYKKRYGVFLEYCKHGMCMCGDKKDYCLLKLVVPISYLVNHFKSVWTKLLMKNENNDNITSSSNQNSFILCRGRSYVRSIKRTLCSEDLGVIMLGNIKVCSSSGRLQLTDATGSIDVVVSKCSLTWNFDTIYEVEKFSVVMHGPPHKLDQSSSAFSKIFTCRSIFAHAPLSREDKLSIYVHYNFDDQKSRYMCSPCINPKGTLQEPEDGTYHLLWLRHKFPLLIEADQDNLNRSSVFAECIMLPWKLNITKKNELENMTGLTSEEVQNTTTQYPTKEKTEKGLIFRKCKTTVALSKVPDSWSCDASSETHGSQAKCEHLDPSEMLKISCMICSKSSRSSFQGLLHCADTMALKNSGLGSNGQKLLLEFDSNALYLYQGLRIDSFYIVTHDKKCEHCNTKVDRSDNAGSMYISRETGLWSVSFLSRDGHGLNTSELLSILSLSNSFFTTHQVNIDDVQQFKLSLTSSDVSPDICSDISLFVPVSFLSYLKSSLTEPFVSVEEDSRKCNTAPESSSGISYSNLLLPEGNLVSLDGLVAAVHDFNHDSVNGHWENEALCSTHQPEILEEKSRICIHMFVGNQMAKIFGNKRKQLYPTGFSEGVHATIHRVLVISEQNEYMMTPASFISVNAYMSNYRDTAVSCSAHANSAGHSLDNFHASTLISEITASKDAKPIHLRVRIASLYVLVLRSKRKVDNPNTREQTGTSIFDIPLAGFFIDDGSSSCCCWANQEGAATLLKLCLDSNSPEAHAAGTRERSRSSNTKKKDHGSKVTRLNKILCRYGEVVVKNHGSMFDSSCLDLAISVESGHTLSRSDEEFLRSLILDACFSTTWQIVGSVMDSTGYFRLEEQLREVGIETLPFQNVLASKVFHSHPLSEARQMLQDLINNN